MNHHSACNDTSSDQGKRVSCLSLGPEASSGHNFTAQIAILIIWPQNVSHGTSACSNSCAFEATEPPEGFANDTSCQQGLSRQWSLHQVSNFTLSASFGAPDLQTRDAISPGGPQIFESGDHSGELGTTLAEYQGFGAKEVKVCGKQLAQLWKTTAPAR